MDLRTGPAGSGAFTLGQTVRCRYEEKEMSGKSPKFFCVTPGGDGLKVKYGAANGEVYGEVAATRLLWALGFGADRMFPVRIICRGCPASLGGQGRSNGEVIFDAAVVERKKAGAELGAGWSWRELDDVDEKKGGASRVQLDALKLLAVLIQHTDTKPEQQRILCLDEPDGAPPVRCRRPLLMLNDVGVTFGQASNFNRNMTSSVNFKGWESTPVWKDWYGCTGNLPMSLTGTLDNPAIGDEGREFLGSLLTQLSDRQIRDLFEVSRVTRRQIPGGESSLTNDVDDWVAAFKKKRQDIVDRRCDA
jgi:hypothetical protein